MIDGTDSTLEERIKKEAIRRKAINDFIDQLSIEQLKALKQSIILREYAKEHNNLAGKQQSYYQEFIDSIDKLNEEQKKSLETAVQETQTTDYTYKFVK